jgi:hypothetical protein
MPVQNGNGMEAASTPYGLVPTVLELLKSVFGG